LTEVTGFIDFINERQTSFGAMYDIKVNGTNYGVGKFKPKGVEKGDYVTFTAEQKNGKYWNVKQGTLRKLDKPAGVAAPAAKSGSVGGFSDGRQVVISKQAALNTSLTMVKLLADAGALPMPAKVAQDKKADLVERIVYDYAAKFYKLSTGETFEFPEDDDVPFDLATVEEATNWNE
jgi:hypothetical protein